MKASRIIPAVLVVLSALVSPAVAMPSDDILKAGCGTAQSVLTQLEKNDTALRINRGRIYNELSDLFYAMNARVAVNRLSSAKLAAITDDYSKTLQEFRTNYGKYDTKVTELMNMECTSKPEDFYNSVVGLRDERIVLQNQVSLLDNLMQNYVSEFKMVRESANAK